MHKGTIKSINARTITMDHDDGSPADSHLIPTGATITLNNVVSALGDLKKGDKVSLTGDPVSTVVATR